MASCTPATFLASILRLRILRIFPGSPGSTRRSLAKRLFPDMVMTRMGPRDLSLFHWKAPDGSTVLVWNTTHGYGWGVGLGLHLDLDKDRLEGIASDLRDVEATTRGPIYMGWGTDLFAPNSKLIENMGVLNQHLRSE